jgi:hypothetical protein
LSFQYVQHKIYLLIYHHFSKTVPCQLATAREVIRESTGLDSQFKERMLKKNSEIRAFVRIQNQHESVSRTEEFDYRRAM